MMFLIHESILMWEPNFFNLLIYQAVFRYFEFVTMFIKDKAGMALFICFEKSQEQV